MKRFFILWSLLVALSFSCQKAAGTLTLYSPDNPAIQYTGRIRFDDPANPRFCGAASYFIIKFKGTECRALFELPPGNHHYIAVELDGKYVGRMRITQDQQEYVLVDSLENREHMLRVAKATEALLGDVILTGIKCHELESFENPYKRHIEFIGNSITSGTGVDQSDYPCDSKEAAWHDHHNAYLAYGPVVARKLDADWLLGSVSGAGVCRNWNSEGPTVPQVYAQTALNLDTSSLWTPDRYSPNLISICLGTNDFSDGDGSYDRGPLDEEKFMKSYVAFVRMIRGRYAAVPICLLTSPVFSGEKAEKLFTYLTHVSTIMRNEFGDKNIHVFRYANAYHNGCTGHPNREEQEMMAEELLPFFKGIMGW